MLNYLQTSIYCPSVLHPGVHQPIHPPTHPFTHPSIHLSIHTSIYSPTRLSSPSSTHPSIQGNRLSQTPSFISSALIIRGTQRGGSLAAEDEGRKKSLDDLSKNSGTL